MLPATLQFAMQWLLKALLLTILLEAGIGMLLTRDTRLTKPLILCNFLTNPAMNFILMLFVTILGVQAFLPSLVVLECIVIMVEMYVLYLLEISSWKNAFCISLLMNFLSLGLAWMPVALY